MEDIIHANSWVIYLCSFIAPFIQEDLAVIGAVSAIISKMGHPLGLFVSIATGLMLSDLWKYWLGRAAITQPWARKHSDKPAVHQAKEKLDNNMFKTIFISRFLPASICVTAIFYIGLIYMIFFALGEIAGEKLKAYLPFVALSAVILYLVLKRFTRKTDVKP